MQSYCKALSALRVIAAAPPRLRCGLPCRPIFSCGSTRSVVDDSQRFSSGPPRDDIALTSASENLVEAEEHRRDVCGVLGWAGMSLLQRDRGSP